MPRIVKSSQVKIGNLSSDNTQGESIYELQKQKEKLEEDVKTEVDRIRVELEEEYTNKLEDLKEKVYSEYKEKGYEEGKELGYAEGYEAGKESGYADGKEKATEDSEIQNKQLTEEFLKMIQSVEDSKSNVIRNYEDSLAEMAIKISEKVMNKEIEVDNKFIINIIKDVTKDYRNVDWIKINLPNEYSIEDIEMDKLIAKELSAISKDIRVEYKKDMNIGDCTVETPDSTVDIGLGAQLNNIKDELINNVEN